MEVFSIAVGKTGRVDPRRLVVLAAVADEGGVGPAARALGHTPSAVSQQLSRLEREAGVPLVDRSGPHASLTEAGHLLAEHGRRVDRVLADAAGALGAWTGAAAGRVVLGVPPSAIAAVVGSALPELAERYPEVEPVVVEVDAAEGVAPLRSGRVDALLLGDDRDTATVLPPRTVATVLVEDEYRVVVPAGWTSATGLDHRRPITGPAAAARLDRRQPITDPAAAVGPDHQPGTPDPVADLDHQPWIVGPVESAHGRAFARFISAHGLTPARTHVAAQPWTTRAMLAAGLGAAVLPQFTAVRTPGVVVCEFDVPGSFVLRMVRRQGRPGPVPAVEAAVAAVRAAVLHAAEDYADSGTAPRDPVVTRLRDPSER